MDQDRDVVRDYITRMMAIQFANAEIETLERATGWVVVTRDLEYDRLSLIGTFENVGDALAYASSYGEELNREFEDGEGWSVDVHPILPIEELRQRPVS